MKNNAVVYESKVLLDFLSGYLEEAYPDVSINRQIANEVIRDLAVMTTLMYRDEFINQTDELDTDNPDTEEQILRMLWAQEKEIKQQYPDHSVVTVVPLDITGRALVILTEH